MIVAEMRALAPRDWLELGGRIIIAVTAASFAIGVLIVNISLAGAGVLDLGLLRGHYVMAGATWLLLFGCGSAVAAAVWYSINRSRDTWQRHQRISLLWIVPVPAIFIYLTALTIDALRSNESSFWHATTWVATWTVVLLPCAIGALGVIVRSRIRPFATCPDRTAISQQLLLRLELAIGLTVWLAGSLPSYVRNVYRILPTAYGGGRPTRVLLSLDRTALDGLDPATSRALMSQQYRCDLLAETGDWVLVRTVPKSHFESRIVQIRRDHILAVSRSTDN